MQMTLQELSPESFQKLTATASAFHVRLSALLETDEASRIQEELSFLKSCGWLKSESLVYFSQKTLRDSSITRGGRTFGIIISTMDELGYDVEWQVLNSKDFGVPQNRERVFIIGHLRGTGSRKVFPIRDGSKEVDDLQRQETGTITTRTGQASTVGTYIIESKQHAQVKQIIGGSQGNRVYDPSGISVTLSSQGGGQGAKTGLYAIPNPKSDGNLEYYIRKLTPKECFRLQGFSDEYFERARAVNSDSQLYKQAGNSVTVNVIYEIARRLT